MNEQHAQTEFNAAERRREALKPLISQARAEGLWLHHSYMGLWLSPDELEKKNAEGTYLFDPRTFRLRPATDYLKEIDADICRLTVLREKVEAEASNKEGS